MTLRKKTGILLLGCLVVGGSALAAQPSGSESTVRLNRFKFTETLRKEIKTESGFNRTETESAELGTVNLACDLPLSPAEGNAFVPSTPFVMKAGSLEFHSTLDQDPEYRPGVNSAILKLTAGTGSDKTQIILATASLHWDRKKLSVKIDAKTPAIHNVAAENFIGNLRGGIDGETKVSVQFGNTQAEATVPFRGKLDHIIREDISTRGEVITVNLHGELKKP